MTLSPGTSGARSPLITRSSRDDNMFFVSLEREARCKF